MVRLVGPDYHSENVENNSAVALEAAAGIDWESLSPAAVRLATSVAAQIERLIVAGRLQDGRRLPSERRLAELLGVSRGSVREAITELEVKGLVKRRPGAGTQIQAPSHSLFTGPIVTGVGLSDKETTELLDLREAIEPPVAARAAERATEADVAELRMLVDAYGTASNDADRIQLDADFHQAIARATHNSQLAGIVERFMHALDATRRANAQTDSRWRKSKAAHQRIVAAIAASDPDLAEREMLAHVRATAAFLAEAQQRRKNQTPRASAKGDPA